MTRLTQIFQQFTGTNAIMFYAPVLFGGNASLYFAVVNVLSTLVPIGQRMLLPEAGVLMFLSQVAIDVILGIILICTSLPSFAWSWGPLGWLIPSEIRSAGPSVPVCVNLLFTFVTAQAFLSFGIFLFFSGWVLLMSAFLLPETKNVTEAFLADPSADKVNVGVGAYRNDHGKPVVLECVGGAQRRIAGSANTYIFIITLLALFGFCRADIQPKDIFILAGQSNMSGRGGAIANNHTWDGLVPPECKPSPSIFRFNQNFTWEQAREPLHMNIDCTTTCGVGPGMPFANSLLKLQPSTNSIGLVPCAAGGKSIVEWNQTGELYRKLILKTRASLEGGGVLRALIWYQGESDTSTLENALSYRTRFEKLVRDVRADLSPTLPIIQVALASGKIYKYIKMVREAQLGLHLPYMQCVDAMGSQLEPDQLHLTTHSQVLLGEKIAQTFITHNY